MAVGNGKLGNIEGIVVVQMFGSQKIQQIAKASSNSSGQASPTPFPKTLLPIQTAINNISSSAPEPKSSVLPAETEMELNYKLSEIPKSQPISTDSTIKPTAGPIKIDSGNNVKNSNLIKTINITFVIYSFIFAAISLLSFFLLNIFEPKRMTAFRALSHVTIFILSLVISSAQALSETFIF